ncbi:carbon-nitrogen hydrolase family protein [Microbacterium sp. NPDC096154]|uniref:carbon-nitrogen hydrolase family protein n=1 Tax=Microbacterium sp. NPDC096154 TaxID=3155549 RepID=UPI00332486F9
MTVSVGIGVAQFAPTADASANLEVIGQLARRAVERGASVVLFPEYSSFFTDPFDETLAENAESLDGPFVQTLTALAGELGVHLVAGVAERASDGERVRNTVVAVDGSGVRALYRKQHLYDAFGQRESDWIEPGPVEPPQTFEVAGLTFGLMTCYDLRFPEVARVLADAGADVALVPAEWVRGPLKEHHWTTLLAARAIENTMYVAAADHPPTLGVGHSAIIDPLGVTVAGLGTATDVAVGWADRDTIRNVRRVNPALELRRYRVTPR